MKNFKRVLAVLLALIMVLSLAACGDNSGEKKSEEGDKGQVEQPADDDKEGEDEEPADDQTAEEDPDFTKVTDAETLVVGGAKQNGDYINGFTNSSYDVWIKRLIGNYGGDLGYAVYYSDEAGEFQENKTVLAESPTTEVDAEGNKTYTFKIKDNLLWSDGEPITAKDYVFGNFFTNSPAWAKVGASNVNTAQEILGFDEYLAGETKEYKGLKVIDDHTFSITLKAEYVPYFYEVALVAASPTPMHRYTPNLDIDGSTLVTKEGYEVTEEDKNELIENYQKNIDSMQDEYDAYVDEMKAYYEEMKADKPDTPDYDPADDEDAVKQLNAINDAKKDLEAIKSGEEALDPTELLLEAGAFEVAANYRFNPDVTCGPYKFVSFENGMAKVTLNDKFVGNGEGKKPTIPNVIVQAINDKLDVDYAISGNIDIAPGVIQGAKIDKAKEHSDEVKYVSYPRNGYGVMPIICDRGATQYKGVRQALAYLLDRNEFVQNICGGYGKVVNGAYGINQFEYIDKGEEMEEDPNFKNYTLNIEAANAALDTTPYKFEADGKTPWDPAVAEEKYNADKENFDYWRYDENGKALAVYHQGTADIDVSNLIATQIPDNGKRAGLKYVFSPVDFNTMLTSYYAPSDKEDAPTVFNMGNGFGIPNDPYYSYHSDMIGSDNLTRLADPKVDQILETMRKADPSDKETWENGWLQFQLWYNDNLPAIPLYGNEYYDIYNARLKGLETTPMWDWSNDICDLSF